MLTCILLVNTAHAAQKTGKAVVTKTSSIAGQVFVVTKGGENIKLALVGVSAIPEKQIREYLSTSQNLKREVLDKMVSAKKEWQAATLSKEAASARWSTLYRGGDGKGAEEDKAWNESKACEEFESLKFTQYMEANTAWLRFKSGEYYFAELPVGVNSSKTDADGKFKLDLPAGKYALAAKSSRHVFGNTEEYYWIVFVNASSQNQSVMLSNDNLFDTECSDCAKSL